MLEISFMIIRPTVGHTFIMSHIYFLKYLVTFQFNIQILTCPQYKVSSQGSFLEMFPVRTQHIICVHL